MVGSDEISQDCAFAHSMLLSYCGSNTVAPRVGSRWNIIGLFRVHKRMSMKTCFGFTCFGAEKDLSFVAFAASKSKSRSKCSRHRKIQHSQSQDWHFDKIFMPLWIVKLVANSLQTFGLHCGFRRGCISLLRVQLRKIVFVFVDFRSCF